MKFIEKRTLSGEALRRLCIRKNWYTCGTNEEYWNLFQKLTDNCHAAEMTADRLAAIADDIYWHSDPDDCADGYIDIPDIMHDLASVCRSAFIEI